MFAHRLSAWKTIAIATALVVVGFVLTSALLAGSAGLFGAWTVPTRLAAAVAAIPVGVVAGWALLVVSGGLIGLQRDTLERRGVPYPPSRPREGRPSSIRHVVGRMLRRDSKPGPLALRAGEVVEVRSLDEILSTLDERGTLGGLVFMPEMAPLCGRQFKVLRRVDKLNDWVGHTGLRLVRNTVLLDGVHCTGAAHDGCQAACYVRWNESWLRRADGRAQVQRVESADAPRISSPDLYQLTRRVDPAGGPPRWVCQSTELSAGTTLTTWGNPGHYLRDLVTGNIRPAPLFVGAALAAFNTMQRFRGGARLPSLALPNQTSTPTAHLDLQPGEWVRVKSKDAILETLNSESRNRGLWFDIEMQRYCGGTYRVAARVDRLIDERSGQLRVLKNPCIILDGLSASGEYNGFCAQAESIFWREIWLERVAAAPPAAVTALA